MNKETKEKFRRLIKVLQKVDASKFNLDYFASQEKCGTVCCAVGWAGMDKWFRERKFKTNPRQNDVKYIKLHGFDAASKFFNLNNIETRYLFHPCHYPANKRYLKYVINRIQNFVKMKSNLKMQGRLNYLITRDGYDD